MSCDLRIHLVRAGSGEEVVISKNKRPFVKLLPIANPIRQREFGGAKGLIEMADNFDEPLADFEEYISSSIQLK